MIGSGASANSALLSAFFGASSRTLPVSRLRGSNSVAAAPSSEGLESNAAGVAAGADAMARSKPGGAGATSTMMISYSRILPGGCTTAGACGGSRSRAVFGVSRREGKPAGSAEFFWTGARKRRAAARCCGVPCRPIMGAGRSARSTTPASRAARRVRDHGRGLTGGSRRPCAARSRGSRRVHRSC